MPCTTLSFVLAAAAATVLVDAKPEYVARVPNGANVNGVAALGHVNPSGGGANNEFGLKFRSVGETWTQDLCMDDSDGDGQTNGQELGDPCCEWVQDTNAVLRRTTGLSHPGDALSMSDASLWEGLDCSMTGMPNVTDSNGTTDDVGAISPDETGSIPLGPDQTDDPFAPTSRATSLAVPAIFSTIAFGAGVAAFFM
uniref:Temptin Cys/Cys disulfide domain-containing protein n=1 Tax=Peronospora matthiolae TaxID=2874970 RepID=A0AAV1T9N6_9STRA